MAEATLFLAFFAGIASFLSPCILPLVPAFLAHLAGTTVAEAKEKRREIFANALFFVLGFAIVFSALGVLLNTLLESVAYDAQAWLARIGGAIMILFGLSIAGVVKTGFFEKEFRPFKAASLSSRYLSSLLFGAAFAAGWTPCVGAILGGILGLAASAPGSAFLLLLSYSAGLGAPFLATSLFAANAAEFFSKNAKLFEWFRLAFGIVLVILGILVFTQLVNRLAGFDFLFSFLA